MLMQMHPKSLEHVPALKSLKLQSTKVMKSFTSLPINRTHSLQCISHMCSNLQWRWVLQQQTLCFWFQIFSFPICVILITFRIFIQLAFHIWKALLCSWVFYFQKSLSLFTVCSTYKGLLFLDSFAKHSLLLWKNHCMSHTPAINWVPCLLH